MGRERIADALSVAHFHIVDMIPSQCYTLGRVGGLGLILEGEEIRLILVEG